MSVASTQAEVLEPRKSMSIACEMPRRSDRSSVETRNPLHHLKMQGARLVGSPIRTVLEPYSDLAGSAPSAQRYRPLLTTTAFVFGSGSWLPHEDRTVSSGGNLTHSSRLIAQSDDCKRARPSHDCICARSTCTLRGYSCQHSGEKCLE